MALTTSYLAQINNLKPILEAVRNAQAPEKFTSRFLLELGFESTNDRLIVGVFKGLGLLDEAGTPTDRYFAFLDDTQSDRVLAEAIKDAYGDLFRVNSKANEMEPAVVKQKLKTLTRGTKSAAVIKKMATTFVALCRQANFEAARGKVQKQKRPETKPKETASAEMIQTEAAGRPDRSMPLAVRDFDLAYNIHIELPPTRDQAVYDAIFRSIREHLL